MAIPPFHKTGSQPWTRLPLLLLGLCGPCLAGHDTVHAQHAPSSQGGNTVVAVNNPLFIALGSAQYGKIFDACLALLKSDGLEIVSATRTQGRLEGEPDPTRPTWTNQGRDAALEQELLRRLLRLDPIQLPPCVP